MSEGSYEAKLHAFRRTQDGVVISYVVHPDDVSTAMATAPLGTRYMIGFAIIGDTEQKTGEATAYDPVQVGNEGANVVASHDLAIAGGVKLSAPATNIKDRRPFASLPLSQQAAIRCGDKQFQGYIIDRFSGPIPYRPTADNAAILVREHCGVSSRSDIKADTPAGTFWEDLEDAYQAYLTSQRYASVAR